jgi:peptide-methionine (S)-S-oxide reductase
MTSHTVLHTPIEGPFPEGFSKAVFGMGCFWGAERKFWQLPGVYTTAVGYAGGDVSQPTYRQVCNHNFREAPWEHFHKVVDEAMASYDVPDASINKKVA